MSYTRIIFLKIRKHLTGPQRILLKNCTKLLVLDVITNFPGNGAPIHILSPRIKPRVVILATLGHTRGSQFAYQSGFPDWGHQLKIKIRTFKVTKIVRMSPRISANPRSRNSRSHLINLADIFRVRGRGRKKDPIAKESSDRQGPHSVSSCSFTESIFSWRNKRIFGNSWHN